MHQIRQHQLRDRRLGSHYDLNRQLAAPAVYGFLIQDCLDLFVGSARDIERHCGVSAKEAYLQGVRSCPTEITNLVAAFDCAKRYGGAVLETVPGFYCYTRDGNTCWRMDIEPFLANRGLLFPVRSKVGIVALKVYRHAQDKRPFTLRVREDA